MDEKTTPPLRAGAVPCKSMQDVRREIDRVDQALVVLLAERLSYIEQAGVIKSSRDSVRDEARIEDVIAKVQAGGTRFELPAAYLEDVFRHLIEWSIAHEFVVYDDLGHADSESPDA
ncbi:MAG: chorismate mutase [Pseudomonadota bacterium]